MITSSAQRDRFTPTIASTKANSAAKSREAVPSDGVRRRLAGTPVPRRWRADPARATSRPARRSRTARPQAGGPSPAAGRGPGTAPGRGRRGGGPAAPAGRAGSGSGRASPRPGWASAWSSSASCKVGDQRGDPPGAVPQVGPVQRGDLVVARAAGAQLAAEVGPGPVEQAALEGGVHVLVARVGRERPVRDVGGQVGPARPACRRVRRRSAVRRGAARPACALRTGDVVGGQPEVELGGPGERDQLRRRARANRPPQSETGRLPNPSRGGRDRVAAVDQSRLTIRPPRPARPVCCRPRPRISPPRRPPGPCRRRRWCR